MTTDQQTYDLFLTGGTGLLGSHFLALLLKETSWKIKAIRRTTSKMDLAPDNERIDWVTMELDDVNASLIRADANKQNATPIDDWPTERLDPRDEGMQELCSCSRHAFGEHPRERKAQKG